ncbi:hypothetical protein [Paraburkholderia phenazinium]|jgi:hypothetical protein|uniref:Uncharacterized protein n=1 Tax=Paraburkholderia phenazinium TaxID=60549 RepID=A0A1G7PKJ4_9BURK|nr:hypothetical protein [Paraburkholderia phenazinium]SDF86664.1 hypothetical protein SAMN05216466_101342 [Paraburkholderia phenazinium]
MKFVFACLRSAILFLFGLMFVATGCSGFIDAAMLLQARNWPVVAAHLDQCDAHMRYDKSGARWELTAAFSYGPGFTQHYEDTWTPADAPTYTRSAADSLGASEASGIMRRLCDAQAIATLRVSAAHPSLARRSEAVDAGDWKRDLGFGLFAVLGGLLLCAVGWSLFPRQPQPGKSMLGRTRIRESRARKTTT